MSCISDDSFCISAGHQWAVWHAALWSNGLEVVRRLLLSFNQELNRELQKDLWWQTHPFFKVLAQQLLWEHKHQVFKNIDNTAIQLPSLKSTNSAERWVVGVQRDPGLPLMIMWLLRNRALQLSVSVDFEVTATPPLPSFSSACCPVLLLSATCDRSARPLCHLTHWTPDTEPPR